MKIINWELLRPMNLIMIGLIVLLVRFAFFKVTASLDGKMSAAPTTAGGSAAS